MKKILLLFTALSIIYFSNTPRLSAINPRTWLNAPNYEKGVNLGYQLTNVKSSFYTRYKDIENLDFIMHKVAHTLFYSILAFMLLINIKKKRLRYAKAWLSALLFAFTDECHQLFIVGRSGRALDVCLDSAAAFAALLAICYFLNLKNSKMLENEIKK